MVTVLARDERIEIGSFDRYRVKKPRARAGRRQRTGQPVAVEAKRIPFFRAGKELKVEVNGAAEGARARSA